jgi:hypothetical protein
VRRWHRSEERAAWLFLTPEVEREVPELMDLLAPNGGEERARIERIVAEGDSDRWFAFLRDCRVRLERAVAAGADDSLCRRLAAVLLEQYLLAPGVPGLREPNAAEGSRLASIARREAAWVSR